MTTNRNQLREHEAQGLNQEACRQDDTVIVLTIGHMPDESDPAWPSKSGQAD